MSDNNLVEISLITIPQTAPTSSAEELWEEMEALELDIGTDMGCCGGGVVDTITLQRN